MTKVDSAVYGRSNLDKISSSFPIGVVSVAIMVASHSLGYGPDALPLLEQSGHSVLTSAGVYGSLSVLCTWIGESGECSPQTKLKLTTAMVLFLELAPALIKELNSVVDLKDCAFVVVGAALMWGLDTIILKTTQPIVKSLEDKYQREQQG